ncbi:MAG: ATP-dependent DNA helicase [Tagaea sp.]
MPDSPPSIVPFARPRGGAVRPPAAPVLVAGVARAAGLSADGEIEEIPLREAAARALVEAPILVHAPAQSRRLGLERIAGYDALELFAFVRPAKFCVPTPRGLAVALGLDVPAAPAAEALAVHRAVGALLAELAEPLAARNPDTRAVARAMARGGWRWAPSVLAALGDAPDAHERDVSLQGLEVWRRIDEWSEQAPEAAPGNEAVAPNEARRRLAEMLGADSEARPEQADYASAAAAAFLPKDDPDAPRLVVAEAGTGVGKTLGYLAPATLWAQKNGGAVWVSTYTKNLQHQIDRELDRLFDEPAEKRNKVVLRKGRENYLCLLNMEEAVGGVRTRAADAVPLGLMARWAAASRDGDMVGGDFPAWLPDLVGKARTRGLADRRGECVYSACPHYTRCPIEKSARRARKADIVVANHALVMIQAALGAAGADQSAGSGDARAPQRYVFDEGHHVFEAADSAFGATLSGLETSELRRWIVGAEGGRARRRGLKARAEDLIAGDEEMLDLLERAVSAARALPGDGWLQRLPGETVGPTEAFLAHLRKQAIARDESAAEGYSLETEPRPPIPGLLETAAKLDAALARIAEPMMALAKRFAEKLDDQAADLDTATRARIEAIARGLARRAGNELTGWRAMLKSLSGETPPEFVDWIALERVEGRDADVALERRWVDPTVPFAANVLRPAHGALITSATLTDQSGDVEKDWLAAAERTGARHMPAYVRAQVRSPFDYANRTRVLVVNDLGREEPDRVAAAYRELFLASGGGALGLFTAIGRLKAVHARIGKAIEQAGLPLYAQHVDRLDVATLVDIFRAEEDSCLLGTDAVRDGVDVPGNALRLIVFDRVPWPRPDIVHKARRAAFGKAAYDDRIVRLRLRQAFGRLIRKADDRGVFVLLDGRFPSRLAGAFPPGTPVERVGLAEAIAATRAFFNAAPGRPRTES